jgi:uncharacterized protein YqcC (DUF446 family)
MTMETEAATAAEDQSFEDAFAEFSGASIDPDQEETSTEEAKPEAAEEQTEQPEAIKQQVGESDKDFETRLQAAEEAAKTWEHKFKSEVGRQTALQRKVSELEAQLKERPQSQQAQRQYSERMQGLMNDFPEIAQALQEELETQLATVREEVQQAVAPMKQQEEQRQYAAEEQQVVAKYPEFAQTVNSSEFLEWFKDQPDAVQALAASPKAKDAIAVMDYYSASRRQVAANPEVQNILAKRNASLERNVAVKNTAPAPVADSPDDFEAAFAHFARKRNKT